MEGKEPRVPIYKEYLTSFFELFYTVSQFLHDRHIVLSNYDQPFNYDFLKLKNSPFYFAMKSFLLPTAAVGGIAAIVIFFLQAPPPVDVLDNEIKTLEKYYEITDKFSAEMKNKMGQANPTRQRMFSFESKLRCDIILRLKGKEFRQLKKLHSSNPNIQRMLKIRESEINKLLGDCLLDTMARLNKKVVQSSREFHGQAIFLDAFKQFQDLVKLPWLFGLYLAINSILFRRFVIISNKDYLNKSRSDDIFVYEAGARMFLPICGIIIIQFISQIASMSYGSRLMAQMYLPLIFLCFAYAFIKLRDAAQAIAIKMVSNQDSCSLRKAKSHLGNLMAMSLMGSIVIVQIVISLIGSIVISYIMWKNNGFLLLE